MSQFYKGCPKCGKFGLEQVTQGHGVSKVWGISVDGHPICEGLSFHPHKAKGTVFRCKECLEVVHEKLFNPAYEEKAIEQKDDKKPD